MSTPNSPEEVAKHILFLLVNEQRLRVGDEVTVASLTRELDEHQIAADAQQAGIAHALKQGWLKDGPDGTLQLTQAGFAVD